MNYGLHYCSVCRNYASGFEERNPKFEDSISETCPNCGASLPTVKLYRNKEVPVKNYADLQTLTEKFKIQLVLNTKNLNIDY